jgi:hypothetical protein
MLKILTLNWNGADKLATLQKSLLPALDGLDYTWYIRDNGSIDNSVKLIESWANDKIVLIKYPNNQKNYAQGMNFLFKEATPNDDDLILTLNNDVILQDTTSIKNMIKLLQEDKNIGIVGAKLNYTNTNNIQHCGVLFHKRNGLPYHYRAGVAEAERDCANRYYPVVTGAVSMLPAQIFANCYENPSGMRGFKEEFFFAFEDVDMCMRISKYLNKKVVYCGQTNIFHEESASLKKNPVHKMFLNNNCKLFLDAWYKDIDVLLSQKYEDANYNLYKENK